MFDFIWEILYNISSLLCEIMQYIYETFEVFAGTRSVQYQEEETFLINIFFNNPTISRLYWGMAVIGIVFCFGFGVVAVIRKMFDSEDKMQTTLGAIVGSIIKSVLFILMMNFLMVVILNSSNVLLKQVDYVFGNGNAILGNTDRSISFTEEDYATMGRIYNVIGNHAVNTSYDSRLNINSCFNEIRQDMLLLDEKEVFEFDYDENEYEKLPENWQSVLVPIARARSLKEDIPIDEYDIELVDAIIHAMEVLKSDANFKPLTYFKPTTSYANVDRATRLDAIVMMTGTMKAAENPKYNQNPSVFDTLRGTYVASLKDVHDTKTMDEDFDFSDMDFLLIIVAACFLGYQFIFIAINAVARIFNIILLYLAAPPIIAASPLDGGGKMKQWTTAFVVQSLSIVGALLSMRLVAFFIPIIYSDTLKFFPQTGAGNSFREYLIRLFFVIAVAFTANKSIGMLSGILADSAGWQSINAGNVGDNVVGEMKAGFDNLKGVGKLIFGDPKEEEKPKNQADAGEKEGVKPDGALGMGKQTAQKSLKNMANSSNDKGGQKQPPKSNVPPNQNNNNMGDNKGKEDDNPNKPNSNAGPQQNINNLLNTGGKQQPPGGTGNDNNGQQQQPIGTGNNNNDQPNQQQGLGNNDPQPPNQGGPGNGNNGQQQPPVGTGNNNNDQPNQQQGLGNHNDNNGNNGNNNNNNNNNNNDQQPPNEGGLGNNEQDNLNKRIGDANEQQQQQQPKEQNRNNLANVGNNNNNNNEQQQQGDREEPMQQNRNDVGELDNNNNNVDNSNPQNLNEIPATGANGEQRPNNLQNIQDDIAGGAGNNNGNNNNGVVDGNNNNNNNNINANNHDIGSGNNINANNNGVVGDGNNINGGQDTGANATNVNGQPINAGSGINTGNNNNNNVNDGGNGNNNNMNVVDNNNNNNELGNINVEPQPSKAPPIAPQQQNNQQMNG